MKRAMYIIAGLAILMTVAGCGKKEPVDKHLVKVFATITTNVGGTLQEDDGRMLQEEWFWEGDRLVRKKYYSLEGELLSTAEFTYMDDRLTKVEETYSGSGITRRLDVAYDEKGRVASTNDYTNDELMRTYTYMYDNSDKTNGYIYERYEGNIKVTLDTFTVEWNGNNVAKKTRVGAKTEEYFYDNHPNPYFGVIEGGRIFAWMSENNAILIDGSAMEYTYDDDGWPVSQSSVMDMGMMSALIKLEFEYDR